jgi:predicted Rossmann-fold nucleotide-binding protein
LQQETPYLEPKTTHTSAAAAAAAASADAAADAVAGVMDAAMKGARSSSHYKEGDTIAVIPGEDAAAASSHADIVICTGLGSYRNGGSTGCYRRG